MKPDRQQVRRVAVDAIADIASRSVGRLQVPSEEDLKNETVLTELGLDAGDLRTLVAAIETSLYVRVDHRYPSLTNRFTLGDLVAHFTDQQHRRVPIS